MRTNLRRLKSAARVSAAGARPAQKSWAERHAPLATIIAGYSTLAAVIVAGLGYYFTVIPLYQKAAVDEQLARREAELLKVDERLAAARRDAYELSRARLLDSLAISASWECGAGRGRSSLPQAAGKLSPTEDARSVEERLSLSYAECLGSFTDRAVKAKKLTDADLQKLVESTVSLGAELDRKRLQVLEQVRAIPKRARIDESVLDASTIDKRFQRLAESASPYLTAEQRARSKERWFLLHVGSVQLNIASQHWSDAADAIRDFYWSGMWPRINVTE